jgi:hypothetical protein
LATTDEQKAIWFVLEALRVRGTEWLRRRDDKAAQAVRVAQGKYDALTQNELSTLLLHGGPAGKFDYTKVIFLSPPAKEDTAVAALWCRWDYEKDMPQCGFYFGLWSAQPAFPTPPEDKRTERHIGFIGYRFETPEEGDNHNYYHAQPCRSMGRKDDEIEVALPVSNRMPTWPVAANGALELLLCLVTAIYGMKGLRMLQTDLNEDPAARKNDLLSTALKTVLALGKP